jgi:hypothetical protein
MVADLKFVLAAGWFGRLGSNRSFEPTRNGWSLQAPISFWAFRAQPPLAAQLRRWASRT